MPVLLQNHLPERQTPLRVTAGHHANRVRQNHHAERVSFCQLDSLRYSRNYGYWALRQRRNVPRGITLMAAGKLREIRNIHVFWEYPNQSRNPLRIVTPITLCARITETACNNFHKKHGYQHYSMNDFNAGLVTFGELRFCSLLSYNTIFQGKLN